MLHQRRPCSISEGNVLPMCQPASHAEPAPGSSLAPLNTWPGKSSEAAAADDCSSSLGSETETIAASFLLQGPSKEVLSQLCSPVAGREVGQRFLSAVRAACKGLRQGSSGLQPAAVAWQQQQVLEKLQEVHNCIVELDDSLDEQQPLTGSSQAIDACRQWLKQAQGYILHITRNIEGLRQQQQQPGEQQQQAAAEQQAAAAGPAWLVLCQDAHEVLSRVADRIMSGGASDDDSPKPTRSSRIVQPVSRLPYSTYWSRKIAL